MAISAIGNTQVNVGRKICVDSTQLGGFCNLIRDDRSVSFPTNLNFNSSSLQFTLKASRVGGDAVVATEKNVARTRRRSKKIDGVKLYVGLPLNTVSECNTVNNVKAIAAGLKALKLMGVEGVELPIWWGIVERNARGEYNWSGYLQIVELVKAAGLKIQVSLCFHGSQEDPKIPLPEWVTRIGENNPEVFFTDRSGRRYKECLSLAVDDLPVLDGVSPVGVYRDFCESFKSSFGSYMGSTVTGIIMGLGPNGELSYPSWPQKPKIKCSVGVGEFQCYDKYIVANLKQHAESSGNQLWGNGGPHDAPAYDQFPTVNNFFKDEGGSWETPYGKFFLSWYSAQLISHGNRLLSMASSVFKDTSVMISGKIPLMHQWRGAKSRPCELTAGFYNRKGKDGYEAVAEMFGRNATRLVLPGMDLADRFQPQRVDSCPEVLVSQIKKACKRHGVRVSGENSAVSTTPIGIEQIKENLMEDNGEKRVVDLFIYQRMGADFFSPRHFPVFTGFARNLSQLPDLHADDLASEETESSSLAGLEKEKELQVQAV